MADVYVRNEQPHQYGERITVFWPGGPHDFVIEFQRATPGMARGWLWLRGFVVEPNLPEHRMTREFYVQPVDGGYALIGKA